MSVSLLKQSFVDESNHGGYQSGITRLFHRDALSVMGRLGAWVLWSVAGHMVGSKEGMRAHDLCVEGIYATLGMQEGSSTLGPPLCDTDSADRGNRM